MADKQTEERETMVNFRVTLPAHTAIKLIRKQYKELNKGDAPTLPEALWQFILDHDPKLAQEARELAAECVRVGLQSRARYRSCRSRWVR